MLGGLQAQVSQATVQIPTQLGLEVAVVACPLATTAIERARNLIRATEEIRDHVGEGAALYCARLYSGLEPLQVRVLQDVAVNVPVIVRCATTDDARRLAHAIRRVSSTGANSDRQLIAHCLNQRSVALLQSRLVKDTLRPLLALNSPRYSTNGRSFGVARRPSEYFYCGRDTPSKNLGALTRAWDSVGPSELNLYGPKTLHKYQRPGKVRYRGCYSTTPPFTHGDVVIVPSFREGHSNVLVEAFWSGAIVIGTDIPGVKEHLREGRGVLLDRPFGVESFREAVRTVESMSGTRREEIVKRARRYARRNFGSHTSSVVRVVARAIGTG